MYIEDTLMKWNWVCFRTWHGSLWTIWGCCFNNPLKISWSARLVPYMVTKSFSATNLQSWDQFMALSLAKSIKMTPVLNPLPRAGHGECYREKSIDIINSKWQGKWENWYYRFPKLSWNVPIALVFDKSKGFLSLKLVEKLVQPRNVSGKSNISVQNDDFFQPAW